MALRGAEPFGCTTDLRHRRVVEREGDFYHTYTILPYRTRRRLVACPMPRSLVTSARRLEERLSHAALSHTVQLHTGNMGSTDQQAGGSAGRRAAGHRVGRRPDA